MTLFKAALLLVGGHLLAQGQYQLNPTITSAGSLEALKFEGPCELDNYLAMNVPFEPVAELFRQLLLSERRPLTSRGEAHITVVSPLEYWRALRPRGITMGEINGVAEAAKIQSSEFEVICLGKGSAVIDGSEESTFFIVVESADLLEIRRQIQQLLISKGGARAEFDPLNYFPHITVGFTKRDLHEEDGVFKGRDACIAQFANFK